MKYPVITLLALGCANAYAQSGLMIYGVADAGIVLERGTAAGNTVNLSSGIASGSRLGFKGTEDLGGGVSASFVIESGVALDSGAAGQGGCLGVLAADRPRRHGAPAGLRPGHRRLRAVARQRRRQAHAVSTG